MSTKIAAGPSWADDESDEDISAKVEILKENETDAASVKEEQHTVPLIEVQQHGGSYFAFAGNVHYDATIQNVGDFFSALGCCVFDVQVNLNYRGVFRIEFTTEESLQMALSQHNQRFFGRLLRISADERDVLRQPKFSGQLVERKQRDSRSGGQVQNRKRQNSKNVRNQDSEKVFQDNLSVSSTGKTHRLKSTQANERKQRPEIQNITPAERPKINFHPRSLEILAQETAISRPVSIFGTGRPRDENVHGNIREKNNENIPDMKAKETNVEKGRDHDLAENMATVTLSSHNDSNEKHHESKSRDKKASDSCKEESIEHFAGNKSHRSKSNKLNGQTLSKSKIRNLDEKKDNAKSKNDTDQHRFQNRKSGRHESNHSSQGVSTAASEKLDKINETEIRLESSIQNNKTRKSHVSLKNAENTIRPTSKMKSTSQHNAAETSMKDTKQLNSYAILNVDDESE